MVIDAVILSLHSILKTDALAKKFRLVTLPELIISTGRKKAIPVEISYGGFTTYLRGRFDYLLLRGEYVAPVPKRPTRHAPATGPPTEEDIRTSLEADASECADSTISLVLKTLASR